MKFRMGHVSNSSSSSFVCSVCGEIESGFDQGLSDFEMYECENGHVFHESCSKRSDFDNFDIKKAYAIRILEDDIASDSEWKEKYKEENKKFLAILNGDNEDEMYDIVEDVAEDYRYSLPQELCPICRMESVDSDDVVKYLMAKHGENMEDVVVEIKGKFNSYAEFMEAIEPLP